LGKEKEKMGKYTKKEKELKLNEVKRQLNGVKL
jgi:hypothetical protein